VKPNRPTNEQIQAARAKAVAEIEALDPIVGSDTAYARALNDGTRAMPAEFCTEALQAQRVRWEQLTTARRRWESADAEAEHSRMVRENDR
jgi:hypothetical protein